MNGDSIKVRTDAGEFIDYTVGMEYSGGDEFTKTIVSSLNMMTSSDAGLEVINGLSESENSFYFAEGATGHELAAGSFDSFKGGGGIIWLSKKSITDVAHETFHSYQYETGLTPIGTDAAEVGAFLFESVITNDLSGFPTLHFGSSESTSLLYGGFNSTDYGVLIRSFKTSSKNTTGIYDNMRGGIPDSPLIKRYLPLK